MTIQRTLFYFLVSILFFSRSNSLLIAQQKLSIVFENGKYGVRSTKGKFSIPPQYDAILDTEVGLMAVKNEKGLWGFYQEDVKITECLYDNFSCTPAKTILCQKGGRWGCIDFKGTTLIDHRFQYLNFLTPKSYRAGLFNQWTVRNFSNDVVTTYEFDSLEYLGQNVYKFCLAGKFGLADQQGEVITTEFQTIFESTLPSKYPSREMPFLLSVSIVRDFAIPEEKRFDTVYSFKEGFAKFKSGGKYGFVDSLGNIRLVPQYNETRDFSEGLVAIKLLGKWGFMNTDEKLIVQPNFDEVTDYLHGVTVVRKGLLYNLINAKGVVLYGEYFTLVQRTFSGNYLLKKNKKLGLADPAGHELVSTKYEEVQEIGNGFIAAKEHGLWGIVNSKGNVVIPFNFSVYQYDPENNRMLLMETGVEKIIPF